MKPMNRLQSRQENQNRRRLKAAGFPYLKTTDDLLTVIIHKRLLYNPSISFAIWSADFTNPTSTSRLNMTSPK